MARPKKFESLVMPEPCGFATEADAHQWAFARVDEYLAGRAEARAKKKECGRRQRERVEPELTMSLRELAELNPHSPTLRYRIDRLWQEVAFRAWKDEANERRAYAIANESAGRRWPQRPAIALSGKLDEISEWTAAQALANAHWSASKAAQGI
jgi:hypothetical protein